MCLMMHCNVAWQRNIRSGPEIRRSVDLKVTNEARFHNRPLANASCVIISNFFIFVVYYERVRECTCKLWGTI